MEWSSGAIIYWRSDSGPSCIIPRDLFACVHTGAEWCVWKACRNANWTHFVGTCRGFSLLHNFSKVCYTSGSHCLFFKPLNPPSFSCSKGQIFWQLCAGTRFVKSLHFYSYKYRRLASKSHPRIQRHIKLSTSLLNLNSIQRCVSSGLNLPSEY